MTPQYIDDIHISIAAPSAPQWLTAMDASKRFCHVGHCNNAFSAGLKAIALGWMKFEDAEGFPLTPDLRRCGYMCDAYAMDKGVKLPAPLPDAYIDSIVKWREIAPEAGIPKSVLPAFVPSVSFNYKFIRKWQKENQDDRKKYLSAKAWPDAIPGRGAIRACSALTLTPGTTETLKPLTPCTPRPMPMAPSP